MTESVITVVGTKKCPLCGTEYTGSHSCSLSYNKFNYGLDETYNGRIAKALERIANTLEKLVERKENDKNLEHDG